MLLVPSLLDGGCFYAHSKPLEGLTQNLHKECSDENHTSVSGQYHIPVRPCVLAGLIVLKLLD